MLTDPFGYTASDGSLSDSATLTVTIQGADDPATPDDDAWQFLGNTELEVDRDTASTPKVLATTPPVPAALGVLDGDVDPDGGPAITISEIVGCADTMAPFDCILPGEGTVSLQADGSFSFVPEPGDTDATATFQYLLTGNVVNVGTVTLTRSERIWFVDPNAGVGGDGTSASPFDTLDSLDGAGGASDSDVAGDYIFVHDGTLALSGPMEMEANQHLIGEGVGLSIPVALNGNGSPTVLVAAGTHPEVTNATGDAIVASEAVPVEIVGLSLQGSSNAIDVTTDAALTGSGTLTIGNNVVRGASTEGIDVSLLLGTTGALNLNVTGNTWDAAGTHAGNAVDISRAAGTLNLSLSGNTGILSNNGAGAAVMISGGALANTTITGFSGNSVHQNTAGIGIVVNNATFDAVPGGGFQQVDGDNLAIGISGDAVGGAGMTLTTVQGNLFFDDLDVFGGTSALTISGAGGGMTFAVTPASPDGSGTSVIRASNGAAVDVASTTIDLRLDDLDSTTSGAGVALSSVAGQLVTDGDASVSKTSGGGTAFSVATSSATVTYGGTLNVTAGAGVSLTGSSGAMSFSGGMTLSTGANTGFNATGGGTVTVTDPVAGSNTITTTSGTALNVNGTTIGAADLTFESISAGTSGSPANGIVLNNTGALGELIVTGNAGSCTSAATCTGGAIRNTTSDGVSLTSTRAPSLTRVFVGGSGRHGIHATSLSNGLTLANSYVQNSGNADNEYGLNVSNVAGTVAISGTTFDNAADDLIHYVNLNTNGTLTVNGSSSFVYPAVVGGTANAAIALQPNGTSNLTATIQNNTFTNIVSSSIQWGAATAASNGTSTLDFSNNTITVNMAARGSGYSLSCQESTTGNITIGTNNFSGAGGNGVISIDCNDSSLLTGSVSGNTITNPPGIGMFVAVDEAAEARLTINGNTVTNSGGDGIQVVNFGGVGVSDLFLAITNNQVNGHSLNTSVNFVGGFSVTSFEDNACIELKGNTVTGTPAGATQCGGAPCVDYYVEEVGGAMQVEEVPNTADTTLTAAYVNSTNDAGPVTIFGIIDLTNGAQCPFP